MNDICDKFRGIGPSLMDLSSGIITGGPFEPFGGVEILWHQSLKQYILIMCLCMMFILT